MESSMQKLFPCMLINWRRVVRFVVHFSCLCPPRSPASTAASAAQVAAADTALHLTGLTVSKYEQCLPLPVTLGNKATVSHVTCYLAAAGFDTGNAAVVQH